MNVREKKQNDYVRENSEFSMTDAWMRNLVES